MFLVGDEMQLEPCNRIFIYQRPSKKNAKSRALYDSDNLWEQFDVAILETNHRQGEGSFWADMLKRFRFGEKTEEDVKLLETRRLKHFPGLNTDDARHVFWTNLEVDKHNMKILNAMPSACFKI